MWQCSEIVLDCCTERHSAYGNGNASGFDEANESGNWKVAQCVVYSGVLRALS